MRISALKADCFCQYHYGVMQLGHLLTKPAISWPLYGLSALFLGWGLLPASVLGGAPVYAPTPHQVGTTNGLIMQGGQFGQVIGPPALALMVSMGGGWKSAPWLLGGSAAIGVALSLALAALEARWLNRTGNRLGES